MERRLVTILAVDAVGYSRLVGEDEDGALLLFNECRSLIEELIQKHNGRVFGAAGDSLMAEFQSPVEAVRSAVEVQHELAVIGEKLPNEQRMQFRLGLNLGDVVNKDGNLFGEAVNVASRLEGLTDPGGISISETVYEQVKHLPNFEFQDLGFLNLKNIPFQVHVYALRGTNLRPFRKRSVSWNWIATAVLLALVAVGIGWNYTPGILSKNERPAQRALSSQPSIAVLPFLNLSADPTQDYFADGITEDLITGLAKFPGLSVSARTSSFAYKDKPVTIDAIRKELGVRYILEGSVQKSNEIVRITAQLIDTANGEHIWAERYDRNVDRIFEIQDDVTATIAGTLMGTTGMLAAAELKRVSEKPKQNFVAYDYLMQGWHEWYKLTLDGNREARRLFEEARKVDPNYARAYVALAWTYALDYEYDWTDQYDATVAKALDFAKIAVQLDARDYRSHWILGWAYLYSRQHDQAEAAYDKAREMNPNDPELMAEMASLLIYVGRPQQAVAQLKEAMRRNPFFEEWYIEYLGWAYQEAGLPNECVDTLEKIIKSQPAMGQLWLLRLIASCYADPRVNRMDDAHNTVQKILTLDPTFSMETHRAYVKDALPYKSEQTIDKWIEALSRAGLPK